jgi:AraC-like DNA-binding protein
VARVQSRDEPYVVLGYLRGLFGYVRARQFPLAPVLAPIGLTEADLADPDLRLADGDMNVVFAAAEALTGDANLGLHAARSMQLYDLGIIGHLLMACQCLRDVLDLHARYAGLVMTGHRTEYEVRPDVSQLTFYPTGEPHSRQVIDFSFGGWLHLTRSLSGSPIRALRVEMPTPPPPDASEHVAFFGCPIAYERPNARLAFETRTVQGPLVHGDPALRQALEAEAVRRLRALRGSFDGSDASLHDLRHHVAERLSRGAPAVEEVADAMGTSVRSLQRELARVGTSYRDVVDDVRKELAARYVRDRSLSLVEIALMLGFSDQTALQRAFRRWFDATPGSLRRGALAS